MRPRGSIFWGLVLIVLAALLLLHQMNLLPGDLFGYFWPAVIILFGIWMILRPSRKPKFDWQEYVVEDANDNENRIEANSVFGGSKKKIVSKDFKGGEINSVFGGNFPSGSTADNNLSVWVFNDVTANHA